MFACKYKLYHFIQFHESRYFSYWSSLATIPQMRTLLVLVVDSTNWNHSNRLAYLMMYNSHTILPNAKHYLTRRQSTLCPSLCGFIHLGSQSNWHTVVICRGPTFHWPFSISSKLRVVSAMVCR